MFDIRIGGEKLYGYTAELVTPFGPIHLASIDNELVYCSTPGEDAQKMFNWLVKKLPSYQFQMGTNACLEQAVDQLTAYFQGAKVELKLQLKLIGTDFQRQVWQALAGIPYGESRTYGQVAEQIGKPKAMRAVGQANNKNPISFYVP